MGAGEKDKGSWFGRFRKQPKAEAGLVGGDDRYARYLNAYNNYITQNAGSVGQIESALRSLTYIIPARFKDVELASEALHSGISLLTLYHDNLLSNNPLASSNIGPPPKQTLHNRYTKFWSKSSPLYRRLALLITCIQYTELLFEMAAKRRGPRTRWRSIIGLELIKALCRLILLHLTHGRPLLTSPLPERELDFIPEEPEEKEATKSDSDRPKTPPPICHQEPISPPPGSWKMPRTGFTLPTLPSNISAYLLSRVLTPDDIKPPATLLPSLAGTAYAAEILYILRPVLYALALRHWSRHDRRSWTPWLLGFGLEYVSRELIKKTTTGFGLLEKEEMTRREWNLVWWAVRSAGYENVVAPWLRRGIEGMKGNGGLQGVGGFVGSVLEDYMWLWDGYYFSTATL
ncbi:peroxisome membrane protein [Ascobolus immersus RN42]|uniref:Peroxisomal membrane protein PEX16 n=1 Tax=Ascobolus immersus RN42 TaxID=1160509 RepID=A0A3N4IB70_ASCIM|nr:peroxisome membrane protein [Ascobolus immersus RN42]